MDLNYCSITLYRRYLQGSQSMPLTNSNDRSNGTDYDLQLGEDLSIFHSTIMMVNQHSTKYSRENSIVFGIANKIFDTYAMEVGDQAECTDWWKIYKFIIRKESSPNLTMFFKFHLYFRNNAETSLYQCLQYFSIIFCGGKHLLYIVET